jgi:biopolymer transport protein ExbD
LKVDLPQAKGDAVEQPEVIRILIDAEGDYAINDWEHSLINNNLETVKRAVKIAVGEQVNTPILISADSLAPHQAVMKVMEAVRDLGFTRLGFEAQQVTTDETNSSEKVP